MWLVCEPQIKRKLIFTSKMFIIVFEVIDIWFGFDYIKRRDLFDI